MASWILKLLASMSELATWSTQRGPGCPAWPAAFWPWYILYVLLGNEAYDAVLNEQGFVSEQYVY